MTSFHCDCGYESSREYTVAVINEITGECPVCEAEAGPENFTVPA